MASKDTLLKGATVICQRGTTENRDIIAILEMNTANPPANQRGGLLYRTCYVLCPGCTKGSAGVHEVNIFSDSTATRVSSCPNFII